MKNSKTLFYSHFAVIASFAFFASIAIVMPEAMSPFTINFFITIEIFSIYLLFKMHDMAKKEKEQTNNHNEVSQ
ncbi:hypothetical protein BKM15_16375 [Pseudomonas syringae pv. syringae]|nr:hypothetical protein BKM15_16375 [Pseudomonas syringae pv. syringae]